MTMPTFDTSKHRLGFQLTSSKWGSKKRKIEDEGDREKCLNCHSALNSVVDVNMRISVFLYLYFCVCMSVCEQADKGLFSKL